MMKNIQKWSVAFAVVVCMLLIVALSAYIADRVIVNASTHASGLSVTVTDSAYGANGSDMEDDTKAIQKALDLRKNSKDTSILTVKIPAGTYYISRQLHIYSNTTLSLDKDAVIVRSDDTKRMLIGGFTNSTIGGYGQLENVTITGGTWDGNNQNSDHAVNLMYMWHGRNIHIYNTTIKEVCGSHFIELAAIKNARIQNVTFQDFVYYTGEDYQYIYNNISTGDDDGSTKEPIIKKVSIRSEAIQLEYPGPDNSKTALPYDNTPCRDIIVTGCTFQNCLSGVGNHHPEISTPNIIISNNTFENMGASCVNLSAMTGVVVSGNTATNVRAFLYSTGETEAEITNNTITYGYESVDPKLEQDMFYITDNTDININNNKIYGCGKRAVFDAGGSTITITNNQIDLSSIRAPGRHAVQLGAKKASDVTVDNNTIIQSAMSGIWVSDSSGSITNNIISASGSNGIKVTNDSELTISNNTITSPAGHGISLTNTSGDITQNTISDTKGQGIALVESDGLTISENTVSGSAKHGIYMESSTATLSNNTISKSALNGIRVAVGSDAIVTGNIISDSKVQGLGAESSTVIASRNVVRGSAVYGIYMNGAVFTVTENTIQNSGINSIRIADKAEPSSGSVTENVLGEQQISNKSMGNVTVKNNCFFVGMPPLSSVENINTGVKITWKGVEGAVKYRVYYKTGSGGWTRIGDTTSTSYTWTGAKSGTSYTFTVRCMNNAGTLFASNYDKIGKSIIYVEAPKISKVENVEGGVKITWGKVTGATKYRVYYKTETGSWTRITDTTSTSYTWTGAKSGTKYTFTVRCISSDAKSFTSGFDSTGKTITH